MPSPSRRSQGGRVDQGWPWTICHVATDALLRDDSPRSAGAEPRRLSEGAEGPCDRLRRRDGGADHRSGAGLRPVRLQDIAHYEIRRGQSGPGAPFRYVRRTDLTAPGAVARRRPGGEAPPSSPSPTSHITDKGAQPGHLHPAHASDDPGRHLALFGRDALYDPYCSTPPSRRSTPPS